MDISINGNLTASGDGLSPESAVKSYEDAVLALSRYDGCNLYNAHFHFADLVDPEATYPAFTMFSSHFSTFSRIDISGESHETTRLGECVVNNGIIVTVSNVCMEHIDSIGSVTELCGQVAFTPGENKYAILSTYGGHFFFAPQTDI